MTKFHKIRYINTVPAGVLTSGNPVKRQSATLPRTGRIRWRSGLVGGRQSPTSTRS